MNREEVQALSPQSLLESTIEATLAGFVFAKLAIALFAFAGFTFA